MRAAVLALSGTLLLAGTRTVAADGQMWDLVTSGVTVSSHASWADCSREIQARSRTLERLMRSEHMSGKGTPEMTSSSFRCVAVPITSDRTSVIQSRHRTRSECDTALQLRMYDLRADGYTPGVSGERSTGDRIVLGGLGHDVVSYRCLPATPDPPPATKK